MVGMVSRGADLCVSYTVAGLMPFPSRPMEAVELDWLSRTYRISVSLRGVQRAGPFHVSAGLSWKWDAALAARSATTEEDLLIEVLGRDGYWRGDRGGA